MSLLRPACLILFLLAWGIPLQESACAAPASDARAQLKTLLDAHPELILDVLENHSEELLDIVQQGSDKRRRATLLQQWEEDIKVPKKVALEGRPAGGAADAPITIIAFSDFLCSYCRQAAFTVSNLMKRYPGKIRFIFKQTPKTEAGRVAGAWFITACKTDKAKAWKLYALAFDRQKEVEVDPMRAMRTIAADVGLDAKALETELKNSSRQLEAMFDGDAADASSLGFVGTPYFLVNNMVLRGALPMENFVDAVEMALKHSSHK